MLSQDGDNETDAQNDMSDEFLDFESYSLSNASSYAQNKLVVPPPAAPLPAEKRKANFGLTDLFWRLIAAKSASTPAAVLICLATDANVRVRKHVARNAQTPAEALALLCEDNADTVRAAVAGNCSTPMYLLRKLSNDKSVSVRFAIASNNKMSDAILLSLFLDPDPYVAERASQTLAA